MCISLQFTTKLAAILMLFSTVFPLYADLDDKSLVLYLSFDEGNGKTAKDSSTYGHDGELIKDPTWVDGQFGGKALAFDGAKEQYVIVPINDTLQLREQFSVAFWVKRGDTQVATWNYMVAGGTLKWAVIFNNAQTKTFVYTESGIWGQRGVSNENQPQDWTHLTMIHDTKSEVTIYYDGQKVGGGGKPGMVAEIDGSVMVGARHPGLEFFTGTIDEVYLFNRVITETEINTIKNGEFAPIDPAEKITTTWASIKSDRY